MSRFLGSRLTIVGLLVSILVIAIGVSAVMGAGSGANSGTSHAASPAIQVRPPAYHCGRVLRLRHF